VVVVGIGVVVSELDTALGTEAEPAGRDVDEATASTWRSGVPFEQPAASASATTVAATAAPPGRVLTRRVPWSLTRQTLRHLVGRDRTSTLRPWRPPQRPTSGW
jgi:hypothetical protein